MNTQFLLMARYEGLPIIPVETVCRDFFDHLTPEKFMRKVGSGDIKLPVVRMERSQKAARGVHLNALAAYLDENMQKASSRQGAWQQAAVKAFRLFRPGDDLSERQRRSPDFDAVKHVADLPKIRPDTDATGVYFLFEADECVYVGQSINVHSRVRDHHRDRLLRKTFDTYSWVPCVQEDLNSLELFYIRALLPKLNVVGKIRIVADEGGDHAYP